MIDGIRVDGFKSLATARTEFDDLTVLVGRNNSGKSALMESLLFLRGAVFGRASSISGINPPSFLGYDMTNPKSILHKSNDSDSNIVTITIEVDLSDRSDDAIELLKRTEDILDASVSSAHIGGSFSSSGWVPAYGVEIDGDEDSVISIFDYDSYVNEPDLNVTLPNGDDLSAEKEGFLRYSNGDPDLCILLDRLRDVLANVMNELYYISEYRDITQSETKPGEIGFVGFTGQYVVPMLRKILTNERQKFSRAEEAIKDIAPQISRLEARDIDDLVRMELTDKDTSEYINIVESGSGIRRLAPVIIQIAIAEEGDTVLVEEPGIGVYPQAQERLVEYILEAIDEQGIQVIFTTHSHPLIWKIQNMADDSVGHALEFEKENGQTSIEQNELNRMVDFEDYYGDE